ncbi:small VCP/p97-interacting protein-like isoform X6 [Oncorhynchus keta]|uniref:small VCP/p97-interacting protein-like isoform X6 n=1 Tax=Oncorhynchus keta TaxID=8018 RepID=UPI00227C48AB|nr:small VCP/p97-interacting protein-like isoform X6 [Oncorhynchus keta]
MGMCLPCHGGSGNDLSPTPDRETRRRQLAETAEQRQKEKFFSQSQLYPTHKACRPTKASRKSGCSAQWRALSSLRKSDIWLLCPMTTSRGVKNPQAVERNKKNQEMEKQEMRPSPPGGGGGLKVG